MHPVAGALLCLLGAGVALWGWGTAARAVLRVRGLPWPVTVAVGLGVVIFVGGGLNLAHLAYGRAVDAILGAGWVGAVVGLVRSRWQRSFRWSPGGVIVGAGWVAVAVLLAACLLPPAAYNVHDDLEKYFASPVRMLATGTLAPNPLGSLGTETLGAQAWLHAFVAAHFSLQYLGAVDGWFALLLCLTLAGFGRPVSRWGAGAMAAVIATLAIDPMIVNVSALFSGTALAMAAAYVAERIDHPQEAGRIGLLLGVLYAAMIALKPTLAVWVVLHVASLGMIQRWLGQGSSRWIPWAAATTLGCVAPWLLLHVPLYRAAVAAEAHPVPAGPSGAVSLVSRVVSDYGTAQVSYTLVAGIVLVTALGLLVAMRRGGWPRSPANAAAAAAGIAAAGAYLLFMEVGARRVFGPFGATRYALPGLLAALPCMMRQLEAADSAGERDHGASRAGAKVGWRGWRREAAMLALAVGVAVVFLPSTFERPRMWWRERVPLVFLSRASRTERLDYTAYNRRVFSAPTRSRLSWMQELVPPGEPLVVWVTTPFLLDFRRNPIFHADPAGLSQRWTHWPDGARYVLLEYQGFAVRPIADLQQSSTAAPWPIDRLAAACSLEFLTDLQQRSRSARILLNDGAFVLMRLEP